jgi:hypothetical protein
MRETTGQSGVPVATLVKQRAMPVTYRIICVAVKYMSLSFEVLLHPCLHIILAKYSELIFTCLSTCAAITIHNTALAHCTRTIAVHIVACMHMVLACILS